MFCSSRVSDSCVVLWSAYRPTGTHPTRGPHDREVPVSCRRLCATRKTNYLLEYYSSLDVVPHRVFARPTRPGTTTHPSSPSIHSVRCRTPSSASFHSLCDVPPTPYDQAPQPRIRLWPVYTYREFHWYCGVPMLSSYIRVNPSW